MPTNKEQLQQEHENIIWNIPFDGDGDDKDKASSYCTTLTEKAMERFTEWLWVHYYYAGEGLFAARNPEKIFTLKEILILFMQQEYKQ